MSTICDDLRAAILQAAMQGKLTKQLPEDGNAKDLLKQIETENGKLLANTRELPFEIPDNWQIVSLKDIAVVMYGFPFNSQLFNKDGKGLPLIRIRDILPAESKTYTTEKAQDAYIVRKGDMLVGMDGNFNVNFWGSEDAYLNQRCCKITTNTYYNQRLLYWFLPYFLNDIFENVSYTTVKHLSDKHLTKMVVPLPPPAEQERIVEKVDELMARVADLEQSADALASLKKAFPDDIKASLLQAAMQGKLTKREPNDDNAEELYEKIIKERSAFRPNKFIDKDCDEAIIPEEWSSLKTGEVFELIAGEKVANGEDLPLLDAKYFRGKQFSKTNKGNLANKNDVLILVDGENSGETFLCTEPGYMGSTFKSLFIPSCINRDFALYFLEMNRKTLRDNKRGAAIPHLDKKLFFNFIFPIPSLAEQKRIVERLNTLMQNINVVVDLIASE